MDDCLAGDERIKKFKKEERAGKDRKRLEREAAEKSLKESKQKAAEEQDRLRKEAEEASKAEKAEGKKAKEAAKNAVKKNKRVLKGSVKDANYLLPEGQDAGSKRVDEVLNDVEAVMAKIEPEEMALLASKLNGMKLAEEVGKVWGEEVRRLLDAGKIKDGEMRVLGE